MTHRIERGAGWELHLGDCLEILPSIGKVDHCITDPPYEAEAHTKARRLKRGRHVEVIAIDFDRIDETTREAVAAECLRIARRWVIAFCQAEAVGKWSLCFGAAYKRACVWIKTPGPGCTPQLTGDRPGMGYESIVCAHTAGRSRWNGGGRVGVYECRNYTAVRHEHPTTKPLRLMLALVSDFTDAGETVLDPFAGSGTTGVACLRLGRRFIGIEREPKYFDLACERLRAEERGISLDAYRSGQASIFDRIGGTQ